tara:strand:+ start:2639 stop:3190 length:552 start_codon:yes stop_codon:yes gene_type:complete
MSDSIKKWDELKDAEKARQRVVAQNGPSGLHYDDTDEDIELAPVKEWSHTFTATNTGDISGNTADSSSIEDFNYFRSLEGLRYGECPSHHVEEEEVSDEPDFKKITDSIADLLKYKNIKYGNSALEPMDIFQGKCKVGQRLDDKLARVKNGGELQKNDIADLIGYLTLVCVENKWDNFEEFKD